MEDVMTSSQTLDRTSQFYYRNFDGDGNDIRI